MKVNKTIVDDLNFAENDGIALTFRGITISGYYMSHGEERLTISYYAGSGQPYGRNYGNTEDPGRPSDHRGWLEQDFLYRSLSNVRRFDESPTNLPWVVSRKKLVYNKNKEEV